MEKTLRRNDLQYVSGKNELCNCKCDLLVTELLERETTNKADEASMRYSPYHFVGREIGAYCPECKSLYYIHAMYEASSKTDNEEIDLIVKASYFDNMLTFKNLVKSKETKDTFMLYIDGIHVKVLSVKDNDKVNEKIVYYQVINNNRLALNQMNNKCCYKCDNNRMVTDERGIAINIDCEKHGFKEFEDVCEDYFTFYDDDDLEEMLDKLSPGILVTDKDLEEDYKDINKLKL